MHSARTYDFSGSPDLKVRAELKSGRAYTTSIVKDSFTASFNEKTLRISEGDTLTVTVYDDDVTEDDEIGTYEKLITLDTLNARYATWSFGDVLSLRLEFQP